MHRATIVHHSLYIFQIWLKLEGVRVLCQQSSKCLYTNLSSESGNCSDAPNQARRFLAESHFTCRSMGSKFQLTSARPNTLRSFTHIKHITDRLKPWTDLSMVCLDKKDSPLLKPRRQSVKISDESGFAFCMFEMLEVIHVYAIM